MDVLQRLDVSVHQTLRYVLVRVDPVVLREHADEWVVAAKRGARVSRVQQADQDLSLARVDQSRDRRKGGHAGCDLVLLDSGDERIACPDAEIMGGARLDAGGAQDRLRQHPRARADLGHAECFAAEILDGRDVQARVSDLGLTGCDAELADRLDLLALRIEHHRVDVGAGTRFDVAGHDLVL